MKLRPDGTQVSFLAREGDRLSIFLLDIDGNEPARPISLPVGKSVYSYMWSARGDRLIYMSGPRAEFDTQNNSGADFVLYSYDPATERSLALTPPLNRRAVYRVSEKRPAKLFVSPSARDARPRVIRLSDIYTGALETSDENDGLAPVYADDELTPRFATQWADRLGFRLFRRASSAPAWINSGDLSFADRAHFKFFGFDDKGTTAYYAHTVRRDQGALVALDLASGDEMELAFRDDAMVVDVFRDPQTGVPAAWKFENHQSWWEAGEENYRSDFDRLRGRLRGDIKLESTSADGGRWVVSIASADRPRAYYLYNRGQEPAYLFAESKKLRAQSFAQSRAVSVKTKDGFRVTGYLTLPPGTKMRADGAPKAPLPMVVWLHGGPWARMHSTFDPWAQWIADRGYAALNINFRGSVGFGKKFLEAHYGEWGGAMEDDIVALIEKMTSSGVADPERIAVMGESHGGFATMHLVADEPDLAACGIAISGLSDLNLFMKTLTDYRARISHPEDLAEFDARLDRERMQFAADERTEIGKHMLASRSPINKASEVKARLLLAHGVADAGVVPEHSAAMAALLDDRDAAVTYLTFSDEGHLIRKTANWRAMMTVTEAFLSQCFGERPVSIDAPALAKSLIAAPVGAKRIDGLDEALLLSRKEEFNE